MYVEVRYEASATSDEVKEALLQYIQCRLRDWQRDVEEAFEDECQFFEFIQEQSYQGHFSTLSGAWLQHLVEEKSPF